MRTREMQHVLIPHLDKDSRWIHPPFPPNQQGAADPRTRCSFSKAFGGTLPAHFTAGLGGQAQH